MSPEALAIEAVLQARLPLKVGRFEARLVSFSDLGYRVEAELSVDTEDRWGNSIVDGMILNLECALLQSPVRAKALMEGWVAGVLKAGGQLPPATALQIPFRVVSRKKLQTAADFTDELARGELGYYLVGDPIAVQQLCQDFKAQYCVASLQTPQGRTDLQLIDLQPARYGVLATLQLLVWDNAGAIQDIKEQECLLASHYWLRNSARVLAWGRAWERAIPKMMARAKNPDWLMPLDLVDDALKLRRPVTEADFEAVMMRRYP